VTWLLPGFLAGSALVGLPVLLHFLRSKPKVIVRFPTLRFLGESAIRDTRKHRLRRLITLLLRCLIIGLLAAAFARPFWTSASAARRRVAVVAIDNSMSMQARGRWEAQKNQALSRLNGLEDGDQAALLVMHPSPWWLVPLTSDLARVRSELQNVQPGFEKTHYAEALRLAGGTLAATPGKSKLLIWMADEQRLGWLGVDMAKALPPGLKFCGGEPAPAPDRQAAIVSVQKSADPGLTANVRLFAPAQDQRRITVRAGDRVVAEKTISLKQGDNAVELPFEWPKDADGLRVSLDKDDLPADDVAWLALQASTPETVLLDSTAAADFLAHALVSTRKLGDAALKTAALPDQSWPTGQVAIVRDSKTFRPPRVQQLDRFLDAGGPLWIFVDGSPEQLDWLKKHGVKAGERAPSEEAWHLCNWDPEHPVLTAFLGGSLLPLLDVEFYRGFDLDGDALVPIASWPDGKTALAEWSGGGRRVLVAGFPTDRLATNWPTHPSFVPFVHQAAHWLGSLSSARNAWRVGDLIPLPSPGRWRGLDPATPEQRVGSSIRPAAPGLYEFIADGGVRTVFAVNIPPEESDLAPWPAPEQLAHLETPPTSENISKEVAAPALSDEAAESQQQLWWWVLAICAAAIFAELAFANRTAL
jgi:von Willebrand factor type A domain/Aerotolerance regulator N-terminal